MESFINHVWCQTADPFAFHFFRKSEWDSLWKWHFYRSDKLHLELEFLTIDECKANRIDVHNVKELHFELIQNRSITSFHFETSRQQKELTLHSKPESLLFFFASSFDDEGNDLFSLDASSFDAIKICQSEKKKRKTNVFFVFHLNWKATQRFPCEGEKFFFLIFIDWLKNYHL